jgi:hypothetical protein
LSTSGPILLFAALALTLGLYIPDPLQVLLTDAAAQVDALDELEPRVAAAAPAP